MVSGNSLYLKYLEFKTAVKDSEVFLPYSCVLEGLIDSGHLKKTAHVQLSDWTELEYRGDDLNADIKKLRKEYYMVTVSDKVIPKSWLAINSVLSDLATQSKKSLSIYVPYYDLTVAKYFKDFAKLQIKKTISLYPPGGHIDKIDATKAVSELKANGFDCTFCSRGNHAKAYLFDDKAAVVGSFNFTKNGIYSNNELGTLFFGKNVVALKTFLDENYN